LTLRAGVRKIGEQNAFIPNLSGMELICYYLALTLFLLDIRLVLARLTVTTVLKFQLGED